MVPKSGSMIGQKSESSEKVANGVSGSDVCKSLCILFWGVAQWLSVYLVCTKP
jgi:hypothetical protein